MRDANVIDSDKYFHCKANCEAGQRGLGGVHESQLLSEFRELADLARGTSDSGESEKDHEANDLGRSRGVEFPKGMCKGLCNGLRPSGLPEKY